MTELVTPNVAVDMAIHGHSGRANSIILHKESRDMAGFGSFSSSDKVTFDRTGINTGNFGVGVRVDASVEAKRLIGTT